MEFIDTHSHIYDTAFDEDRQEVIQRCKAAGLRSLVLPAIDMSTYDAQMDALSSMEGYAFGAMGLHPTSVGANWKEELDFAAGKIEEGSWCAVGEIGLDTYWSSDFIEEQLEVLRVQLNLALRMNLPVILHVRNAMDRTIDVLREIKGLRGVFHAFSGSLESYKEIRRLGDFKIGIGGVLTYRNAGVASVLEQVPLQEIVLETDCPYLSPVPYRGRRNESSYIPVIASKVQSIKGCSIEEVAEITTENARKLFGI